MVKLIRRRVFPSDMAHFVDKIKNGKPENQAGWWLFCQKNDGRKIRVETISAIPSDELRGYYWASVIPTVKAIIRHWEKMSDDDIHEMLKKLFNFFDAYNPLTKRVERFGRTAMSADSTTERAMEFIDKIGVWLGEEYKTPLR